MGCWWIIGRTRCPNVVCWWTEAIILWQISLNGGLGGPRWVARELPRWVVRKFPSSEPRLTAEPGCLYCPPRKFPTLGKGKITDLRSPGQPGKSSQKRSPCRPKICEIFQIFWLALLNFSSKMKNGSQQTRDAVPRNYSSKREKEILECDEFSMCEHVWTSVQTVRVQRIVAGFLRNIDNVCGHWAIIEMGFQVFFTQLNLEAMYCECIFRCRWQIGFSSLLHFVVNFLAWKIIQHCNKQLPNLSKCQCWLCWLLPKLPFFLPDWTQSELLACFSLHQLHKGRQLYISF